MAELQEKRIEVKENWVGVIASRPCVLDLGIVSVKAQGAVMKNWKRSSKLPDQVHLGEGLGQIAPVLFGVVEVGLDLAVPDVRIEVDLLSDLVNAARQISAKSSIVVTRGLDKRWKSKKPKVNWKRNINKTFVYL